MSIQGTNVGTTSQATGTPKGHVQTAQYATPKATPGLFAGHRRKDASDHIHSALTGALGMTPQRQETAPVVGPNGQVSQDQAQTGTSPQVPHGQIAPVMGPNGRIVGTENEPSLSEVLGTPTSAPPASNWEMAPVLGPHGEITNAPH